MHPTTGTDPCTRARSLKSASFAACWLVVLLLASCATEKRCFDKFPCTPVDTVVTVQVTYRDTVVYRDVPPVVLVDSVPYVVPCADTLQQTGASDTVRLDTPLASARAWVARETLHVGLTIHGQRLAFVIDSAVRAATKTVTIYQDRKVEVKVVPPFYRACLYVSIILIVLFVVIIFIALRL